MLIPFFIAILLGLVSPSDTNNGTTSDGTVITTNANGGENPSDSENTETDPVSGETGQIKPPLAP